MNEEELNHQKQLVDKVLQDTDEETLHGWIELKEDDFWYNIVDGGYLRTMEEALEKQGVNIDSIKVMKYVEMRLTV